jgi:lipid II:glycine glycyltransferase (peptidoglycan interpeptide bridge formation enzyme)
MGGSIGVVRFKEVFGGEVVQLSELKYLVLKPVPLSIFQKLLPFIQKNKSKIAGILSKLK